MGKQRYRGIGSIIIGAALILIWADDLPAEPLRENVNLPGMDYRNFSLPSPDPRLCEQACSEDPKCMAFTYVKPGIQGREARCWLKSGVPQPIRDPNCVSGVKTTETRTPPSAGTRPQAVVEKTQQQPIPQPPPRQVDKPDRPSIEQKPAASPGLGPQFEQFRTSSPDQARRLNRKEEQIRDSDFEVSSGQFPAKSPADASLAGSLPQITDISPKSAYPGSPVLIKGHGFPPNAEAVLYDPTGEAIGSYPPYNSAMLTIKKCTSTAIEAELPAVRHGLRPISGPRDLFIRVRDSDKKQYSNNSPPFTLFPNMVVGVYHHGGPYSIEKKGTQVLWNHGDLFVTGTVFHLNSSYDICKGADILVQDLSIPQGWSIEKFEFSATGWYCYDSQKGEFQPLDAGYPKCSFFTNLAELDQDLKDIKGKTFLPKASVSWVLSRESGFSYSYTILVRKPEGF
jgi:hypothetical protein